MNSKPINLSQIDVLELKQFGTSQISRAIKGHNDADEMPAEQPHQVGDRLWGRESVARRHKEDAPCQWLYQADGYVAGRFYLQNYLMKREACRFELEVVAERLEYIGNHWVALTDVRVVTPVLYVLDFNQVAEYGRGTRKRPTFPARMLDFATDPSLRTCQLVQTYQRYHHDQWYLPLVDAYVRAWLKKVHFTKIPVVSVGGLEMAAGREVPTEEIAQWIAHYSLPQFTRAYLLQQQQELGPDGCRQFNYGKEHERAPRLTAINHLLSLSTR
jgi:hypothetical protein